MNSKPVSPYRHHYKESIWKHIIVFLVIFLCIWFVIQSSSFVANLITSTQKTVTVQTAHIVSNTIGKAMKQDNYGNINVLLVGYGGAKHDGGFLADSIIVVSFDPREYSVSMISIPSDLIVNSSGYINRINTIMAYSYNKHRDLDLAVESLAAKVYEITGIPTTYHALIDFNGFVDLVDQVGGIDVYIPKKVYDTTYPGPNYSYTTFSINSGYQHLDGNIALKYVRSRHSSSDFSRSQRQQLILKWLLEKMTQQGLSLSTLQKLYTSYKEYVHTNITLEESLWLLAYGKTVPPIYSFGFTMECANANRKTMQPWCLLYPVDSSLFGGISGLLPVGASIGKISYYTGIQNFSNFVAYNQWFLSEKIPLHIYNSIDPAQAKKFTYRDQIAAKFGSKLKRYGFIVNNVENSKTYLSGTMIVISGTGKYEATVKALQRFLPIQDIQINPATVDLSGNALQTRIDIYIGNTILEQVGKTPFNFYY